MPRRAIPGSAEAAKCTQLSGNEARAIAVVAVCAPRRNEEVRGHGETIDPVVVEGANRIESAAEYTR